MITSLFIVLFYFGAVGYIWVAETRHRRREIERNYRRAEAIAKRMALLDRMETHGRR